MTPHRITDSGLSKLGLTVPHGFFTRHGGVSQGPYASLNCSVSGQDDPACVAENRSRAAHALGFRPEQLLGVSQVHGVTVATVSVAWAAGDGPRADAMVTDRPGLALGVVTADCAPVLLADAVAGVVGAAHAGWRGAVAGVLEATVGAMAALGADPGRIQAAVGPCIAQPSYEVAADMTAAALAADPQAAAFIAPGSRPGRWRFDLAGFCAARLARAGVAAIGRVEADTAAEPERFFSHRRRTLAGGGPIGHQLSVIGLARLQP